MATTTKPPAQPFREIGVASERNPQNQIRPDEFILQLRGTRGIRKLREMRENDATVGAILFTIDQMLRPIPWHFLPRDESPEAQRAAEIVTRSFNSMAIPMSDTVSDILSFFVYGFSVFEKVFRRDPQTGAILLHKLAPRAQWTIERFLTTPEGEYDGVVQSTYRSHVTLPRSKTVLFRTASTNRQPSGSSALRNAYISYYRVSHLQEIEAVSIERELNGLPVGRLPSEYLAADATPNQQAIRAMMEKIVREVKRNEQGYVLLPSDLITDEDGKPTTKYLADIQLITSNGTRDIDIGKTIIRYQQDIARSVMADFVMLGANDRGSFAMSKSKSDLFLKALHGYMDNIAQAFSSQLLPDLMTLNGLPTDLAPIPKYGMIAPVDLDELGTYIQKLALAGAPLFPDDTLEDHLRSAADLPAVPEDRDLLPAEPSSPPPNSPSSPAGEPEGEGDSAETLSDDAE